MSALRRTRHRTDAARRPVGPTRLAAALAAVLVVALASAGCASTPPPAATPTPAPTPLARLNTAAMALPRVDFCTLVPTISVARALGHRATGRQHWVNGQRAALPGVGTEVLAEHGCSWSAGPAAAEAWTYAPPVTPALAAEVVAQSEHQPHCRDVPGPAFGQPTLTQVCARTTARGTSRRVRHAGLFGDTWLTCEVSDDAALRSVTERADAWCVDVASTLNTNR